MPVKTRRATVRARRRTRQYVDRFAGSESGRKQCARRLRTMDGAQPHRRNAGFAGVSVSAAVNR